MELRRADERADKFKDEADTLAQAKHQLQQELSLVSDKVKVRDQEIARLHAAYQGGQTFGQVKRDQDYDAVLQENSDLYTYLDDIARTMGAPDFQNEKNHRGGPAFLVDMVHKAQQNIQDLREDNQELGRVIE